MEDLDYFFIFCGFSKKVWKEVEIWLRLSLWHGNPIRKSFVFFCNRFCINKLLKGKLEGVLMDVIWSL